MEKVYLIIFFVLGAVISSFLCVVGFRLPQKISFVKGSSMCDTCKHKLYFFEKIPMLSYIFQLGRCRYCKIIGTIKIFRALYFIKFTKFSFYIQFKIF